MTRRQRRRQLWARIASSTLSMALAASGAVQAGQQSAETTPTATPIKHVIYIIGENRTFDHLFGTFVPNPGQTVSNLLSKGILKADGTPGPNFSLATQWQASDTATYSISPTKTSPYSVLPDINTDGTPTSPYFTSVSQAESIEPALPLGDYSLLTIGGSALPSDTIDTRFGASPQNFPSGPFNISAYISYDDYAGSPVHRFYQMWQQLDCSMSTATPSNPSGCQADLFPWVETTIGAGSNGKPQPQPFTDQTTNEGAISMGMYNVQQGDVGYFNSLAHQYALSDNYHQAVMGGTGANHLAIGYGQTIFYADSNGNPATPPSNQIEDPDPQSGTNNWYTQDGYSGGSYINCSDQTQPGVSSIFSYLKTLPYRPFNQGDCLKNAYYLVNNYNPGYLGDGTPAPLGPNDFTIPPTKQKNIGILLSQYGVSWKYYGEGWANGTETGPNGSSTYCNICNPFLYSTQIMTNPSMRAHNQDIQNLYADIQSGNLPSVSIVKPDGFLDGHPASSKFELFESFTKKIITMLQANPSLWADTAVMITVDEGGGYYDSGYVQPIDAFGDGTRIPLLVVSPYSKGVGMVHSYGDHVSFDKFVEANWNLPSISAVSRDNLPNPTQAPGSYAPSNAPAISDLMDMFSFPS